MQAALTYGSMFVGILGAAVGLRAATVVVRDNIDVFIGDIRTQSRWATYTAGLAILLSLLQAAEKIFAP